MRYSGITQERASDFVAEEAGEPYLPPPDATAGEAEPHVSPEPPVSAEPPAGLPEPGAPAEVPADADGLPGAVSGQVWGRGEMLAAARAHTHEQRRAGVRLEEAMEPQPWSVNQATRFKLLAGLAVVVAAFAGYGIGLMTAPEPAAAQPRRREAGAVGKPQDAELAQVELERRTAAAFEAMKNRRFAEARELFGTLAERHPEHPELQLEVARAYMYEANFLMAHKSLDPLFRNERTASEAHFILGLVKLSERSYDAAADCFRRSAVADPIRADAHYLWGEAMRRAGRLAGAADRYQIALDRNQYETNELTYRLKVMIARIQEGNLPAERSAELIVALGKPGSGCEPLVADAARALKEGDPARCAKRLEEASKTMEPLLFRVVLSDPFFAQEAWRTELNPLYKR